MNEGARLRDSTAERLSPRRLISDVIAFGRLWHGEPNAASNAVDYAKFRSRSHNAVIRVYDEAARDRNARASGRFQRMVAQFCSQGLAQVKLVYAKDAKWLLSGPRQLQKFAQ